MDFSSLFEKRLGEKLSLDQYTKAPCRGKGTGVGLLGFPRHGALGFVRICSEAENTVVFPGFALGVRVPGFGVAEQQLHDGVIVRADVPLAQDLLPIGVRKCRPALTDIAGAKTHSMGGQKQRVAIAGVVAMRPDCLILDEATAMLDPRGREQVMQTIHYLNRNMGITVVSITHYMEEAAQADRVLVMSKGHVVMEGTPKEVFSQTEKVRSLHLDVPQAAELRDELVKAGIPMPEGIIDTGECAQALYELLQ